MVIIYLGCKLPYTSSDLPEDSAGHHSSSYLVLLRVGFTKLVSHLTTGRLLPCLFTFTEYSNWVPGCVFSVALSLRLPSLGVTQHSALWSSDFPRKKCYFFRDYPIYLSNILFSILKYHFSTIKSISLKESIKYIVSSIELRKRKKTN